MAAGAAAAGAAAGAAAIAQAARASGAIVRMNPADFITILSRTQQPLVVQGTGGVLGNKYAYLTPYRGLVFYTESNTPLQLPGNIEFVHADKIWVPR